MTLFFLLLSSLSIVPLDFVLISFSPYHGAIYHFFIAKSGLGVDVHPLWIRVPRLATPDVVVVIRVFIWFV